MEIVKKIVDVIGVKFVSIDIVKLTNNQYMVMEINSGVMMENLIKLQENGEQIAKDLYESALDLMFNVIFQEKLYKIFSCHCPEPRSKDIEIYIKL